MGTTFSVSTAAELAAAIQAAEGGDRIELAAGNYGELNLTSQHFTGEGVTIVSADPDNVAVFDKITLYRCENMHFDSIEIDFEPTGNTGYQVGFRAAEGTDISISNSLIHGGFDESRESPYDEAPVGIGVQIQRVDNVVVDNNEIYDFHAGVGVAYVDGLEVTDNHIHDMRTSPLAGGGVSNVEVSGNHFESSHPIDLGGTGDHGDMIHFYPLTNQVGPMENIYIRDNFFEQGTGEDAILGIYIDDAGGGGSGLGYTNVVIDNNVLHNGDAQGLRVENVDGLTVTNNSFLQASGTGAGSAPGIVLTSDTENVVIDNNILAGIISGSSISGDAAAALNVQIGDNIFVQNSDPFGDNYVGDIFLNGLTPNGDVVDFTPLAGSPAEGYGSTLAGFLAEAGDYAGMIFDTRGEGLEMQTVEFDAAALFSAWQEIDITDAEIAWDFGDGNTGAGHTVSHTYESAGSYDVTATFTMPGGRIISVDHTVDIFTPEAVAIDFENGTVADVSDLENLVETVGNYNLESSRFGDALRLVEHTSRVSIERSEEILDNPEFTIAFAFQKDGGTDANSDDGMFSYFSGTSYISTGQGTIRVGGGTSTGRTINLEADVPQVEDGAWHHLTYTFSSETGTAVMYLDGEEVDRMEGLTGIQSTTAGHDLLLGGRTGGAFGGLMDEFEFTRTALTPEQVAERYDALFNPSGGTGGAPGGGDTGGTGDPEPDPGTGGGGDEEPVRVVTVCEFPEYNIDDEPIEVADPEHLVEEDIASSAGPTVMPVPTINRGPATGREETAEIEEEETPPAGEESASVYDAILSSIHRGSLLRNEEAGTEDGAEPTSSRGPVEETDSIGFSRLFDILRDTGSVEETMPSSSRQEEENQSEEEDMFSFLF